MCRVVGMDVGVNDSCSLPVDDPLLCDHVVDIQGRSGSPNMFAPNWMAGPRVVAIVSPAVPTRRSSGMRSFSGPAIIMRSHVAAVANLRHGTMPVSVFLGPVAYACLLAVKATYIAHVKGRASLML